MFTIEKNGCKIQVDSLKEAKEVLNLFQPVKTLSNHKHWSDEELDILQANRGNIKKLVKLLPNRNKPAIGTMIWKLKKGLI